MLTSYHILWICYLWYIIWWFVILLSASWNVWCYQDIMCAFFNIVHFVAWTCEHDYLSFLAFCLAFFIAFFLAVSFLLSSWLSFILTYLFYQGWILYNIQITPPWIVFSKTGIFSSWKKHKNEWRRKKNEDLFSNLFFLVEENMIKQINQIS